MLQSAATKTRKRTAPISARYVKKMCAVRSSLIARAIVEVGSSASGSSGSKSVATVSATKRMPVRPPRRSHLLLLI
jgi:hypothetical protein